ncbi:MAG: DUF6516 family protein [Tychonema bourrellyi B0820]|uniref:Uncharacterized protein n=1 Tax=Tychonema bourrellyi FEM_GT703 TaxID=2040638 RepID=A0A2G4F6J0_9CYAN|nr:DUF6516 family protein [Tychonema bourrellyi]MDQ2098784.1 DUF6516 family protein [Tychonema bourrellyi B0820]PHX57311.1 hypothetical protein CP500_000575 [Tychonema bourrellyi FEM_GT703]
MSEAPLNSLSEYNRFVSQILTRPDIERSTVVVWSNSPYTGTAEGEVWFTRNVRLRMREELDFDAGLITAYGYEVYQGSEKLYWYDDFPHPQDPSLASTFPHHKHIPPEIKRNRVPAPDISFTRPNLPTLIQEIEALIAQS